MEDIILSLESEILKIYEREGISMLTGLRDDYIIDSINIIEYNHHTISEAKKYGCVQDYDFRKNFDDLIFLSDQIAFFTANAAIYKDLINDPILDWSQYYDESTDKIITVYPNRQNLASVRYSMYIEISFEKIYNYWGRIGELLWATYFSEELKQNSIDFARVIDKVKLNADISNFESFKWLFSFKENEYKELNDIRKKIVHYTTLETDFQRKHLDSLYEEDQIRKLMEYKRGLYHFAKKHINLSITGFLKVHALINDITIYKKQ